jgi:TolA-binding protein
MRKEDRYWYLVAVCAVCAATLMLGGCDQDKDEDEKVGPASLPAGTEAGTTAPAPRPDALVQATNEIKAGKPADAQPRLEAFLKEEPKSNYRPEALYLLGQALAAQGQFEDAKKKLDDAIDSTEDRTLKALAMLGRADCNLAQQKWHPASRQYHWLETMYRDVKALPQDELMFKLGLSTKKAGFPETADYWFKQVIELYATGPYAAQARQLHTQYTPEDPDQKPRVYTLEVNNHGNQQKADAEADALRAKGYRDVQVIATTRNDLPTYEVHVGKFENKNDALRAQTDAELAGLATRVRPATVEYLK